ncbi:hypothetical protein BBta_1234 [Bradyrhizobium sp. BTAi1]|nr:hypothetical protein BBta_1234 [Bradyrhizobium sp. BTAi1]
MIKAPFQAHFLTKLGSKKPGQVTSEDKLLRIRSLYPKDGVVLGSQIQRSIWGAIAMVLLPNVHVRSEARPNWVFLAEMPRKFDFQPSW